MIEAWREFDLRQDKILGSLYFPYKFQPSLEWKPSCNRTHSDKFAPLRRCECGFYSYKTYKEMILGQYGYPTRQQKECDLSTYHLQHINCDSLRRLPTTIEIYGKIWHHKYGYRSSRLQIKTIYWPRCLGCGELTVFITVRTNRQDGRSFGCPKGYYTKLYSQHALGLPDTKNLLSEIALKYNVTLALEEK